MIENEIYKLYQGDCLEVMDELIKEGVKVNHIVVDLPYETTSLAWDKLISLDKMWGQIDKLLIENGNMLFFSQEPFTSKLIQSNLNQFKYKIIWQKTKPTGFPMCNYRPLKSFEEIILFTDSPCTYTKKENTTIYNPQGLIEQHKIIKRKDTKHLKTSTNGGNMESKYISKFTNYPRDIITFSNGKKKALHPTEKPIELMEYLIKTYTNENDLVLDFTMGSGSTGVACLNLNRKFIGIELDENYFNIAKNRIENSI